MDGNRRWARERGLPTLEGHKRGFKKLQKVMEWCKDEQVSHLVVYALSTENWNRAAEEVSYLMDLFREALTDELKKLQSEGVAIHFAGDLTRFPKDLQEAMDDIHTQNKKHAQYHLWVAGSYGGRPEILDAVNQLIREGVTRVDEKVFTKRLWTAGMPDPDIIIRTGGEKRLSNFLPWQSVYAELFFVDTYWPAFSKSEFVSVLRGYKRRERRHGK
jgi:undecaprenyl diphosphate synthase